MHRQCKPAHWIDVHFLFSSACRGIGVLASDTFVCEKLSVAESQTGPGTVALGSPGRLRKDFKASLGTRFLNWTGSCIEAAHTVNLSTRKAESDASF